MRELARSKRIPFLEASNLLTVLVLQCIDYPLINKASSTPLFTAKRVNAPALALRFSSANFTVTRVHVCQGA